MLESRVAIGLALSLVVACSRDESKSSPSSTPRDALRDSPGAVTYWQHVRPVLQEKCTACHSAGGIAPFALDSYEEASARSRVIVEATGQRTMPPWPPGPLSPDMLYDRSLTEAQVKLIADWVSGGAVEGDAASPTPSDGPATQPTLPSVDLVTDIGVDYTPPGDVRDEYRCFAVDLGMTESRVSIGFRVTPGNVKTVHHVITKIFDGSSLPALRALDDETPERPGWPCVGELVPLSVEDTLKPIGSLGSWVPGVGAVLFPEGTGSQIPRGSVAVVQVHYNMHSAPSPDRTKIELAFAPAGREPSQQLSTLAIRNRTMRIAPGAKGVSVQTTTTASALALGRFYVDKQAMLRMVSGHMHMVGTSFSLTVERASGERQVLLDIPSWNFHWQGSYELATPIPIAASDVITVRCAYDNTPEHLAAVGYPEAPRVVTHGEGSADEMCIGYLTVTDD